MDEEIQKQQSEDGTQKEEALSPKKQKPAHTNAPKKEVIIASAKPEYAIEDALTHLRSGQQKRKFAQTVDLMINIRNIDLKKPENKFAKDVTLPHGRGKDIKIGIIAERGGVSKAEIEEIAKNKKKAKQFVNAHDFFVCEPPLMPLVGKTLGRYLGPRGKMPKPLAPNMEQEKVIRNMQSTVRVHVRESPVVHVGIGTETMSDEHLKKNAQTVIDEVKKLLPGKAQIKDAYIKLTMSKPCKIKV